MVMVMVAAMEVVAMVINKILFVKNKRYSMFKYFLIFFLLISNNSNSFSFRNYCSLKDGKYYGDGYVYKSDGVRELCIDPKAPDTYNPSELTNDALAGLYAIPGLGAISLMATSIQYVSQVGILANQGTDPSADFIEEISTALFGVASTIDPGTNISSTAIALQYIYNTNHYCQYQNIYLEEKDYITRQESSPAGGYPVFPVYPMEVGINEYGQCDYSGAIDRYFKNAKVAATQYYPDESKCSYSYSATRDQCIKDLTIPILSTYATSAVTAEGACSFMSFKGSTKKYETKMKEATDDAKEKLKKMSKKEKDELLKEFGGDEQKYLDSIAEKALKKAKLSNGVELTVNLTQALANGIQLFVDPRLSYDPITLNALIALEQTVEVIGNIRDYITPLGLGCLLARLAVLNATYYSLVGVMDFQVDKNFEKAKTAMKSVNFCGWDWLSYTPTYDGKYYTRGAFAYSRYKAVYDCINNTKDGSECYRITETVCNEDGSFCNGITKNSRDVRNKIYREFLYSGKEYESSIMEKDISSNLSDNRSRAITYDYDYCIDPRLPEDKGYYSVMQRYYMKGNEKANFACNRFIYDGSSGCVLPKKAIEDADTSLFSSSDKIGEDYFIIRPGNTDLYNKYNSKCKEAFSEARKCCKYRSQHLFCLENKNISNSSNFCFSNVVDSYGTSSLSINNIADFIANKDYDSDKVTCEISGGNDGTYYFEGTKKTNTNYVCVFSDELCPYNFKLNAGLNYRASYCDSNYFTDDVDKDSLLQREETHFNVATCKEGLFSASMREKYKELHGSSSEMFASYVFDKVREDIQSFGYNNNDFETIYDFSKLEDDIEASEISNIRNKGFGYQKKETDSQVDTLISYMLDPEDALKARTSAFGQVKNFCQYRAHCVEVEREEDRGDTEFLASTFLDSSCNNASVNSRNFQRTVDGSIMRQLTAPIVECIHESLNNLINGVSGMSSCVNNDMNDYGYCGSDTQEEIEKQLKNNNTAFFEDRYNFITENGQKVFLVKGEKLPESYNPFLKMQNYFKDVIRAALTIFIVLFGYKTIFSGEMKMLKNDKGSLVLLLTKFSIVLFLIFYNGWQKGIYDYLIKFSLSGYNFVNSIFSSLVSDSRNTVLNLDGNVILKVVETDDLVVKKDDTLYPVESNVTMCYRYGLMNDIEFRHRTETYGCGTGGFRSKPESEIYIKRNDNFPNQNENHPHQTTLRYEDMYLQNICVTSVVATVVMLYIYSLSLPIT